MYILLGWVFYLNLFSNYFFLAALNYVLRKCHNSRVVVYEYVCTYFHCMLSVGAC